MTDQREVAPTTQFNEPCVDVAVALPVDGTFTYTVPVALKDTVSAGKRVLVPFGKRRVTGFVIGECRSDERYQIKPVLDVIDDDPLFTPAMMAFFRWVADYYMYPLGEVIKQALPTGMVTSERTKLAITEAGLGAVKTGPAGKAEMAVLASLTEGPQFRQQLKKRLGREVPYALMHRLVHKGWIEKETVLKGGSPRTRFVRFVSATSKELPRDRFYERRREIMDIIAASGEMPLAAVKERVPASTGYLNYLSKNAYVTVTKKRVFRDPFGRPILPDTRPVLTPEQDTAVKQIAAALGSGFKTFLLSGVTGSGKTEIYLRIAELGMEMGVGVLVLVPEIALISQTVDRFRARFGDRVAVLHSGLSAGEKYDQWVQIRTGRFPVVIGARSAIFAPLRQAGVIIVDEEHDNSYKQESRLRYNARDIAVVRGKMGGGVVVLGSATPSLQSSFNVDQGRFEELTLTKRINQRPLPEISVVDLSTHRDERGWRRFLSPELKASLEHTLARGEQALLFLNRRGYANFPVCRNCGDPLVCRHCDITLTLHKKDNAFRCHFCGFSKAATASCESCGFPDLSVLGLGTEKIEEVIKTLFPDKRVARLDRDTTARKGTLLKTLKAIRNRTVDVLIGTQMVAKGHDFPHITLVGILCADLSLGFPDFRASEHTFQLLAQVAGRAGRGDQPGKVILQTYNPDHFSIQAARVQDYRRFYDAEIRFRRALTYPPVSRIIQLRIFGKNKKRVEQHAGLVGNLCRQLQRRPPVSRATIDILGPVEAPLPRLSGQYRWQILLKGCQASVLHGLVREIVTHESLKDGGGSSLVVDVDPVFML